MSQAFMPSQRSFGLSHREAFGKAEVILLRAFGSLFRWPGDHRYDSALEKFNV